MASDNVHPKSVKAYRQLESYVFRGMYLGVQRNKDYGTWRALFEIDPQDPENEDLLDLLSRIRKWNSHSYAKVRL